MPGMSKESTDEFLINIETAEEVEMLRKALMLVFELKTIVFVVKDPDHGWNIYISNEWFGLPSDDHLKLAKAFVEDQLIEN
jgi:hypothetical protein